MFTLRRDRRNSGGRKFSNNRDAQEKKAMPIQRRKLKKTEAPAPAPEQTEAPAPQVTEE